MTHPPLLIESWLSIATVGAQSQSGPWAIAPQVISGYTGAGTEWIEEVRR